MSGPVATEDAQRAAQVYTQIRANIAFEHMIVAVLIGAAVSGAAIFLLNAAFSIAKIGASAGALGAIAMGALWFAFLAFLVGFAASVAVGVPLFLALERSKIRKSWPYYVAAIAVQFVAYGVIAGRIPFLQNPAELLFLAPGLLVAFLFSRRIKPLWRAAERAETQSVLYRMQ